MYRALPRAAAGRAVGSSARWQTDLRALKEEHVAIARERIFGPQGNMPGDRQFRKKLEGRQLMRWYFPSKYNLQDFSTKDYFEMQAERFAPRQVHPGITQLTKTVEQVRANKERLRGYFKGLDEATFRDNPSIQDLYGIFRLIDADRALPFEPPKEIFLEHSPLFGANPVLRLASGGPDIGEHTREDDEATEQASLLDLLKKRLERGKFLALEARLTRCAAPEEVREVLQPYADEFGLESALIDSTIVLELSAQEKAAEAARKAAEAAAAEAARKAALAQDPEAAAAAAAEAAEAAKKARDSEKQSLEADFDNAGEKPESEAQVPQEDAFEALLNATAKEEHEAFEEIKERFPRRTTSRYPVGAQLGGSQKARAKSMKAAEDELEKMKTAGPKPLQSYIARRHRFIDPMFRRRRLKWLERQMSELNGEKEVKYNQYYATHPDKHKEWPTNKGSVTIVWPSPYH
eukprot:TRINITY_DN3094_c1_g1_i1.p1 TRINITY_DN3094_c1_g1~~TRINITY_DN3094_c1_g1_i1.p1  ORF type:complete len:463 (+),score=128.77 TRINITY_DN3094_c1_g1_i1:99-1487(+)